MAPIIYKQEYVVGTLLSYIFTFVNGAIEIVTFLMFVRAILSWLPGIRIPSAIGTVLYGVTEFFISPVRTLLFKIDFVQRCPIDISFLVTYILLHIVQSILAVIFYSVG